MATTTTRVLAERVLTALYAREPHAKVVVAATGGGSSAGELLFRAGSSSTMLQFSVPYARASLQTFIQEPREPAADDAPRASLAKFCSQETAERMAIAAWKQAQDILRHESEQDDALHAHALPYALHRFRASVGVACTASLATASEKRGPHQCFFSVCRADFAADARLRDGATESRHLPSPRLPYPPLLRQRCETYYLNLSKAQKRTRSEEDRIVTHWLVYLLAKAVDVDPAATSALHAALLADQYDDDSLTALPSAALECSEDPLEGICVHDSSAPSSLPPSLASQSTSVAFISHPDDASRVIAAKDFAFRGIVLPGSFNPLHDGHVALALAAQTFMRERAPGGADLPIAFELAVANADKGAIAASTVMQRVAQFTRSSSASSSTADSISANGDDSAVTASPQTWPVLVTNATLFSQKAALLPGCVFAIGADTAERIVDAKYYGGDAHRMVLTLAQIARCGCAFVVAGRFDDKVANRFVSAEEVLRERIPAVFAHLFLPLSESTFRSDLTSTKLRQQMQQQQDES